MISILIFILKIFLNIIYGLIKIFPVKDKVTIVSRQSNSPSNDIKMISAEIKRQSPNTSVVILCKKIDKGILNKIKYLGHLLRQMWHLEIGRAHV